MHPSRRPFFLTLSLATAATLAAGTTAALSVTPTPSTVFTQTNQISDLLGVARITDTQLVNPWGLAAKPGGPLWVSDQKTGVATVYTGAVPPMTPAKAPLTVTIPEGGPTGQVFNGTSAFQVGGAATLFLFDSVFGTLSAWGPSMGTTATTVATVPGAAYTGLALGSIAGAPVLYAADFAKGTVDVFDGTFHPMTTHGFTDPTLPSGWAPYDVAVIGGKVYVTYAAVNPAEHDEKVGPGLGRVDVYSPDGTLQKVLVTGGRLNAPWGLTIAPASFGTFAGALLIGNFGDGHITAVKTSDGAVLGQLHNTDGNPVAIGGLWALTVGTGLFAPTDRIVFSAGIGREGHGMIGTLRAGL